MLCCRSRPFCARYIFPLNRLLTFLSLYPRTDFPVMCVDQSDPNFADKIRHVRDPKARMAIVWSHCKTKMICDADEPKEEGVEVDVDEPKKGHGGCGHIQPVIRKEGLKLFVQYKRPKDEDEVRISHAACRGPTRLTSYLHRTSSRCSRIRGCLRLPRYTRRSKRCPMRIYT